MTESQVPLKCAFCGKPISPTDSKVTEDGKAIHGECYLAKIKERKSQQH